MNAIKTLENLKQLETEQRAMLFYGNMNSHYIANYIELGKNEQDQKNDENHLNKN